MEHKHCNICSHTGPHPTLQVREMMLGLRHTFTYIECTHCGCLQLIDPPREMNEYYPENYYSFEGKDSSGKVRLFLKNLKNSYATSGKGTLGKLLYQWRPNPVMRLLSKLALDKHHSILDVGCGSGALLYDLKDLGYDQVLGIDPFIEDTITYNNGLRIQKGYIEDVNGKWDLIMFHHAFEHLEDPAHTLNLVAQLLKPNGNCLIRVPVADSYAYRKYKAQWAQIDAPRHYHVFTNKGMEHLAKQSNLIIKDQVSDSTAFQFWGSEQYINDVSLHDQNSYAINPSSSLFSKNQIKAFEVKAKELNKQGEGDMRAFFLQKKT